MASLIFDACALIALSENEEGADLLASFLADRDSSCFVHAINLSEVYYHALRNTSRSEAVELVEGYLELGITLRDDMDVEMWQDAGELKAAHRKVSLADCFAIALANRLDSDLVTSDHHELDALADLGVCKIRFFR